LLLIKEEYMINILVSYARADGAEAAAKLRSELARDDINVWRDVEEMRGGQDWREQLRQALREVDAVLVLLTPAAVASPHVRTEWESAQALKKVVIPVHVLECNVPEELRGLQRRNLSRAETYSGELVSLVRDLRVAIWQPVQDALGKLQGSADSAEFGPLLQKLQVQLNARLYAPEVFDAFIYLIRRMNSDVNNNLNTLRRLLDMTIEGRYVQEFEPVSEVLQENNHIFKQLLSDFRETLPSDPATPIHIVLVVMSRAEAVEMTQFEPLQTLLQARGNWTERYQEQPEDWHPFGAEGSASSIKQVVTKALGEVAVPGLSLVPVFEDIRTLSRPEQRHLLKKLRREGCVVVIDSISLYHPFLQRAFEQSALETYPQTSVVTISPTRNFAEFVREMTFVFKFKLQDMEFIKRAQEEDEYTCDEILEDDDLRFQRWLRNRVKSMYSQKPKRGAEPDIRDYYNQNAGEQR
jgi:hypothetical protein